MTDTNHEHALPTLPWAHGSRLHPWLWTAVVEVTHLGEPRTPRMLRIVSEGATEEHVLKGLSDYRGHSYSDTGDGHIVAPVEPPRTFQTWDEVHAAAVSIPVTLYTVDCPICGVDCVESESEYSATHDEGEYLGYHLENHHHDLPRDADELAERSAVKALDVG